MDGRSCTALTKAGPRCKNRAKYGTKCHVHASQTPAGGKGRKKPEIALGKTSGEPANDPAAVISFYRETDPYGFCSNFSKHPVELGGQTWPTTEHYFQAQKFAGTSRAEEIRKASSPTVAARMGRSRAHPLREDWEAVKDQIMHEAVTAKFTQHPKLRTKLLATGWAELVEHTKNDSYWGDGGDGSGQNRLGETLMRVRDELSDELSQ